MCFSQYHLDPQESQLIAGMRPGDSGYGVEGSEKYGMLAFFLFHTLRFHHLLQSPYYYEALLMIGFSLAYNLATLTQNKDGKLASEPVSTSQQFNYTEYYRQVGKALAGQGPMPVDPGVSASVIRLIELALESSRLEQTLKVRDD